MTEILTQNKLQKCDTKKDMPFFDTERNDRKKKNKNKKTRTIKIKKKSKNKTKKLHRKKREI